MTEQTQGPAPPDIKEALERLAEDIATLRNAATRRSGEVTRRAAHFLDEHPYGALSIAFGTGYLLGGGLLSRTTRKALGIAGRILAARAIQTLLTTLGMSVAEPREAASNGS